MVVFIIIIGLNLIRNDTSIIKSRSNMPTWQILIKGLFRLESLREKNRFCYFCQKTYTSYWNWNWQHTIVLLMLLTSYIYHYAFFWGNISSRFDRKLKRAFQNFYQILKKCFLVNKCEHCHESHVMLKEIVIVNMFLLLYLIYLITLF